MVEIDVQVDCGNSPNKELLKQIMVEGIHGNYDFVLEHLDSEVTFNQIGCVHVDGKEKVEKELEKLKHTAFQRLTIHNIITHGRDAAANGFVTDKDGKQVDFCFVVTLSLGRTKLIKTITAYIID